MKKYREVDLNAITEKQKEKGRSGEQAAVAYIIYMMVGSYFSKCSAASRTKENNLFMYYKSFSCKKQCGYEREVDADFRKQFAKILSTLRKMHCVVYFQEEQILRVLFWTGFETIEAFVDEEGSYWFEMR